MPGWVIRGKEKDFIIQEVEASIQSKPREKGDFI